MISKIRWVWIWFSIREDQGADGVKEAARNQKRNGPHAEQAMDWDDQKDNDPAHQQKADI